MNDPEEAPAQSETEPVVNEAPAEAATGGGVSLEKQLEFALAERDASLQKWMLALADLDNYRRRMRKEADEQRKFSALPLAEDLLPALDNLQRALEASKTATDASQLVLGVQMVARQFDDILAKHQITTIESVGKAFDPNVHRAIQQVPSAEHPPMTVLVEYERGYQMHDRVVRPSTVIVAAPPS